MNPDTDNNPLFDGVIACITHGYVVQSEKNGKKRNKLTLRTQRQGHNFYDAKHTVVTLYNEVDVHTHTHARTHARTRTHTHTHTHVC